MSDDIHLHCMRFVQLITDYEEGKLPPELRAAFEEHWGYCEGCQELLRQLKEARGALATAPTSESVPEGLLEAYNRTFKKTVT